jgi:5-methyltetrahydropteroyltriglutamate--homocysteine methyltransferase
MKRSTDRILTTHVGSLIRPQALQDILRAKQAGQPYDQAAYETCLKQSIDDVVSRQADIGVDIVSDGEFGKAISWNQYVVERLSGFELRAIPAGYRPGVPGADRTRFKEFYAELDVREPMANAKMVACVGPVKYIGQDILRRDIDNFKAALKGTKVEEAFMPVVAPSSVLPDRKDEYYKGEEDWLDAVTAAMPASSCRLTMRERPPRTTAWFLPVLSRNIAAGSPNSSNRSTARSKGSRRIACATMCAGEAGRGRM